MPDLLKDFLETYSFDDASSHWMANKKKKEKGIIYTYVDILEKMVVNVIINLIKTIQNAEYITKSNY